MPSVAVSPDRTMLLLSHRRGMPSLAEVAAPFLGLAGARMNPQTNGPRVLGGTTGLTLAGCRHRRRSEAGASATGLFGASFSPDGKNIGITHTTDTGIRLLVADVATGQIRVCSTAASTASAAAARG